MVKIREEFHLPDDGSIDPQSWLDHVAQKRTSDEITLIRKAFELGQFLGEEQLTATGTTCIQQGLAMADILDNLDLDIDSLIAALIYPIAQYTDLSLEEISTQLNDTIAKLVAGVSQMDTIHAFYRQHIHNRIQLDNLRKMLLAMAQDVRVVLIKLAERTYIMRTINHFDAKKQLEIARETQDIYAPLANRLGIAQIKWELEDLSFRYLEADIYKKIAKFVDQKRTDREQYIKKVLKELNEILSNVGLEDFQVTGRAKHIYSIYRKMQNKNIDFDQVYDVSAVRILVNTIENCYAALSVIHSMWQPIQAEFDDYIAHPKPNGYRSLHTAVIGPEGRNLEVQIRTFTMHQEAELGIAAHWIYKEGSRGQNVYEQKISWLRQLIDWHKEVSTSDSEEPQIESSQNALFEDRVYVFTPTGDIMDLAVGATPLDFAYTIHTEIGHRCKGAKVNGSIVPLTHKLKTGDRIEILTTKHANPSRDWMNPTSGYLKTSRARAKVQQWFKKQDYEMNLAEGESLFAKEIKRLNLHELDHEKLAHKLNYKTSHDMLSALGAGDLRIGQLIHTLEALQPGHEEKHFTLPSVPFKSLEKLPKGINIEGVDNLLTHLAHCCKPVPGDDIVGFITQGRGVTIHRQDCTNIANAPAAQKERLIDVYWGKHQGTFPIDIFVEANDRHGLMRDIAALLANEKINIIAINTITDKAEQRARITLTLEIVDLNSLGKLFDKILQLSDVISVERLRIGL